MFFGRRRWRNPDLSAGYRVKRTRGDKGWRRLCTKLALHARYVGFVNRGRVRQVTLLLRALLSQDVTFKSVLPLDFTSSRELEAFLGASFCFHLRHGLRFFGY